MMDGSKRFTGAKNNVAYNGKLKEILLSSKQKSEEKLTEADIANIPLIKQTDNSRLLPKYSSILGKTEDDGVSMEDLDQLQADLEKLLTTNAARTRHLLAEIGELDRNEEGHGRKAYDKTSLKRKRNDDTSRKFKDLKNGMRVIKKNYGLTHKFVGETHLQEVPKVTLPKNDNSDKFWASIEPYCANVSKDDAAFLETLIQEFSREINVKIPEIGEHYAEGWSDELLSEEQNYGKSPSKKISGLDMKRNKLQAIVETFATPLTQRLLAATIEEKILSVLPKGNSPNGGIRPIKFKACDVLKSSNNNHKLGTCLDRKLMKELMEQGILTLEDLAKTTPEDEILTEIKKCQQELKTMNKYNIEELTKLKTIILDDLRCNELKEKLEKVDKQNNQRSSSGFDFKDEDSAIEGSGYNGEVTHDLESSGSGFGPDDEDDPEDIKPSKPTIKPRKQQPVEEDLETSKKVPPIEKEPDVIVKDTTEDTSVIMNPKAEERPTSFFAQPGILAAVIGGAVVGLLCAILVVMFIVYRMRKKDEGSYALGEKQSPNSNSYSRGTNKEFFA